MSEPFTAAEVRRLAQRITEGWCADDLIDDEKAIAAALTAYAVRLEQDERFQVAFNVVSDGPAPRDYAALIQDERLREEGRREVYAAIAAMEPWDRNQLDGTRCVFCNGAQYETHPHGPDCLWLRAQQATPAPVTP